MTQPSRGKKAPTDKQRLDWMSTWAWGLDLLPNGWAVRLNRKGTQHGPEDTTQRRAMDAAMNLRSPK